MGLRQPAITEAETTKTLQMKETTRAGSAETTLATTEKREGEDRMESVKPTRMKNEAGGSEDDVRGNRTGGDDDRADTRTVRRRTRERERGGGGR